MYYGSNSLLFRLVAVFITQVWLQGLLVGLHVVANEVDAFEDAVGVLAFLELKESYIFQILKVHKHPGDDGRNVFAEFDCELFVGC